VFESYNCTVGTGRDANITRAALVPYARLGEDGGFFELVIIMSLKTTTVVNSLTVRKKEL
jgi:hypothetical protein